MRFGRKNTLSLLLVALATLLGCSLDPSSTQVGSGTPSAALCPRPGDRLCDTGCTPVQQDPLHCGDCAVVCAAGEVCQLGVCSQSACGDGRVRCGAGCVDTQTDPRNCGGCGVMCSADQVCANATCVCPAGRYPCDGHCVDFDHDAAHCGTCSRACVEGEVCDHGVCQSNACGAGLSDCGGSCVHLESDARHCGTCGRACGGDHLCVNGECRCPGRLQDCGTDGCVDTGTHPFDCGACGRRCGSGEHCELGTCVANCGAGNVACGKSCVDLNRDASHCGACGRACQGGSECVAGACRCPEGTLLCEGVCVDANHPLHCGSCTRVCAPTETCGQGASGRTCQAACGAGQSACGRSCTDLSRDPRHCGNCRTACTFGHVCSAGRCVCPDGMRDCAGQCVDVQTSLSHCGACNNRCTSGVCSAGSCQSSVTCESPRVVCDGVCLDILNDAEHCGSCTTRCPSGRCENGVCASGQTDPCGPNHGGCDPLVTCRAPGQCGDCPATYRRRSGRCEPDVRKQRAMLPLSAGGSFRYYRNFPLDDATYPQVIRAVVVVHGSSRNGDDYYERMWTAARMSGAQAETLILGASFRAEGDSTIGDEVSWADQQEWKDGRNARTGVSSFQVMDELVTAAVGSGRFPNLRELILTGHSAGGQFMQRYAMMNRLEASLTGLSVTYAPANPSSYAYLDGRRPQSGGFATPGSASSCRDYNRWKHGLDRLPAGYLSTTGAAAARAQYRERTVVYVIGTSDTGSSGLDTTCMGNLQGQNRLVRARNYFDYVATYYGTQPHQKLEVRGVGHSSSGMFQSSTMRRLLFGR